MSRAAPVEDVPRSFEYAGIETRLLDGDLVQFRVAMTGDALPEDADRYAQCAAAQYSLIRGYGFARHVRTNIENMGGQLVGDAVYTISAALPRGLKTIDAEVIVQSCLEHKIPMV
ncbi:hypothetical protein [Lentibacter algarum]|uniref:hypothetical protein n=1 Tax=Lentibacter algarum TaxID=576131 RepID=UPI00339DA6C7